MGLLQCGICRRVFVNAPNERICPQCAVRLNELYPVVRDFLRDHKKDRYTAQDISEILGLDLLDVQELVHLGFLDLKF